MFKQQLWYKYSCATGTSWTDGGPHNKKLEGVRRRSRTVKRWKHTHAQSHRLGKGGTGVQTEWCYTMSFSIRSCINAAQIWSWNSKRSDNTHTRACAHYRDTQIYWHRILYRAAADKTALLDKVSRQPPSSQRRNIMAKWKRPRWRRVNRDWMKNKNE